MCLLFVLLLGLKSVCLSLELGLLRWQVTGGSLKESREALEIAETDGKQALLLCLCLFWDVLLGCT
jgi:hypothetical protein